MKDQEPALVFVPDLFFQSKIVATANATGSSIQLIASPEALIEECRRQSESLVILDLAAPEVDMVGLIRAIKNERGNARLNFVGFYSHVDKELERRAREAGCDLVLPKSVFSKRLPEILTGFLSIG